MCLDFSPIIASNCEMRRVRVDLKETHPVRVSGLLSLLVAIKPEYIRFCWSEVFLVVEIELQFKVSRIDHGTHAMFCTLCFFSIN